jgi:hypothetical protein
VRQNSVCVNQSRITCVSHSSLSIKSIA